MALDKKNVSEIIDAFLYILGHRKHHLEDYGFSSENQDLQYYLWELKFLDAFLGLQNFVFAGDCGILDFIQEMYKHFTTWEGVDEYVEIEEHTTEIEEYSLMQISIWKTKLQFRPKYSFPNKVDDDIPTPDFVMEFIDAVQENLNVLLLTNDPSSWLFVPEPKDQIEEVLKELKLLRFFVLFLSKNCVEPKTRNIFFTHVLIVACHAAMVAWLYLPIHGKISQGLDPSEMNIVLADLLQMKNKSTQPSIPKIYTDILQSLKLNVRSRKEHASGSGFVLHNLVDLPTFSNPCHIVGLNDQMEILQEMRNLLRDNLIHFPVLDPEFPCQDMDTVIVDAGLLVYSLYDINGEKETTGLEDVNRALGLDLPGNTQPAKEITCLIIQKAFQSNLPRIQCLSHVDLLLNNLKEFQSRYSDSLAPVMNNLQIILQELESTQPFLKDVAEVQHNKHEELQRWATRLTGKAYEVEYVIGAWIRKEVPQWCLKLWLSDIIEEITHIKEEVVAIQERKMLNPAPHTTMDTATAQISSQLTKIPRMTEEIVGFEDVREELRNKLIKGCRQLDVISIVGMPGLGKTTLAQKLYSDNSVISHFDIRAQCCVSQVYKRMDLLLSILHDAIGVRENFPSEADAADKLKKTLQAKRYLILVDDVWEASAWDDLRLCFHDGKNGSRIILTTRHLEVAKYAKSVSEPIPLRMFNVDESWKLLENKVFGKGSFSSPLEEVGSYIVEKCGGLPLSIVLVAGILAKMERTEESWKQVAKVLSSYIHRDSEAIVEQSYRHLPYHLKACYLYFGAFLEDRVIDTLRLKRLWISEGFVKRCEGKSLEDIAEGYLENLIARNLVMVSQRSYIDGKVEKCCLHDVLFEFCKKRATEENFLRLIKWDPNTGPSCIYSGKKHGQPSRLVFCETDTLVKWNSSCSYVGSVLVQQDTTYRRIAISNILQNFKFLKVLELERGVVIDSFPTDLVHLRYFSVKEFEGSIPSSISNLWNLETLTLQSVSDMTTVPITISNMVRLRHLHISSCRLFPRENAKELYEDSSKLHNLRTLSTPCFSCIGDAELMLTKTPNLLELDCHFTSVCSSQSRLLVFPEQLETLYISCNNGMHIPICISSSNLKRLILFDVGLDQQDLSHIGHELQNLQALEMESVLFQDRNWEVTYDEFLQLKVLKLWSCIDFNVWTSSDDAFPTLECLIVAFNSTLEEIPSSFAEISTLKYMQVKYCNESVEKSATNIRETKIEEYQDADFELFIN
ncbi:unnamed protein product [Withania somnifera]